MSVFHQVTVVLCVFVCVALLLPKLLLSGGGGGGRDPPNAEGVRFPSVLQRKSVPAPPRGTAGNSAHHSEAIARAKGGTVAAGKSNLTGQIIPVYGFGILLYILYIIFKIMSRGKMSKCQENRFPAVRSENMKRKITDFELMQLQERLKETEVVMERIVSRARTQSGHTPREGCVSVEQEENLLLQLREITRVMQEGELVDRIPSEMDTMGSECDQFTGDSEEMLKHWSFHCCTIHNQDEGETERADRQMDNLEEMEQTDRRKNEKTESAVRQTDEEEKTTERADGQMDNGTDGETEGDEKEVCTEMMKSEDQHWETSLSGGHGLRQRSVTTIHGTECSQ